MLPGLCLPPLGPSGGGVSGPLQPLSVYAQSTGLVSSVTFTGVDLGAEAPDRLIVISVVVARESASGFFTIDGVTIGGITAQRAVRKSSATATHQEEIYYATVPIGTSADVVVAYGFNTVNRHSIMVYRAVGLERNVPYRIAAANGATPATATLTVFAGHGVAATTGSRGPDAPTLTGVTTDATVASLSTHAATFGSTTANADGSLNVVSSSDNAVAALFPPIGSKPRNVNFRGSYTSAVSTMSLTFTGCDIGAAAAGRLVIVSLAYVRAGATGSSMVGSVTIGGVAATRAVRATTSLANVNAEIWYAVVPTGTTADVAVTYTNNPIERHAIAVYTATGLASTTPDTTVASITAGSPVSLATTANGFTIGVQARRDTEDASDYVTGLDFDALASISPVSGITLYAVFGSNANNVSKTDSFTPNSNRFAAATWHYA